MAVSPVRTRWLRPSDHAAVSVGQQHPGPTGGPSRLRTWAATPLASRGSTCTIPHEQGSPPSHSGTRAPDVSRWQGGPRRGPWFAPLPSSWRVHHEGCRLSPLWRNMVRLTGRDVGRASTTRNACHLVFGVPDQAHRPGQRPRGPRHENCSEAPRDDGALRELAGRVLSTRPSRPAR